MLDIVLCIWYKGSKMRRKCIKTARRRIDGFKMQSTCLLGKKAKRSRLMQIGSLSKQVK